MPLTKIFKHITPKGVVMLTDEETNKVSQILAELIYVQQEQEDSDYPPGPAAIVNHLQDQENVRMYNANRDSMRRHRNRFCD